MIFEALVAASCSYGNSDACNASLTGYAKFYKLDERAQVIEQNVKKKYPAIHFTGVVLGSAVQRKYQVMLYRNVWLIADYSDIGKGQTIVQYRYSY